MPSCLKEYGWKGRRREEVRRATGCTWGKTHSLFKIIYSALLWSLVLQRSPGRTWAWRPSICAWSIHVYFNARTCVIYGVLAVESKLPTLSQSNAVAWIVIKVQSINDYSLVVLECCTGNIHRGVTTFDAVLICIANDFHSMCVWGGLSFLCSYEGWPCERQKLDLGTLCSEPETQCHASATCSPLLGLFSKWNVILLND